MSRQIALAASIAAAFILAWFAEQTPRPLAARAPATAFSAGRAFADDRVIARAPHPVGSAANAAVRDYLVKRMTALGLDPQVQRAEAMTQGDGHLVGSRVENIVGVLPGRDRRTPAVAIMAHYDSVPASPGAADDAAGVAAGLEEIRALKAGDQLPRDVLLVFTDGEEQGLLGARAFFERHPMAKRIGFLLNMEARGGGGRVQMFQTGAGGGETIELFSRTAVSPAANSLAAFLYGYMPNDTDFTIARAAGLAGLNYAFIGRQFDYHAASSTPANLDRGSLQHMGDQVLATTRGAASATKLPRATPDRVYAQTAGSHVLSYRPAMGWAVLALAAALAALGAWRARRRQDLAWADVVKGVGVATYLLVLLATVLRLARSATGVGIGFLEQRPLLAQATRWELALALLSLAIVIYAAAATGRGRARFASALVAGAAGLGCSLFAHRPDWIGLVLGALAAIIGLSLFGRPIRVSGAWLGQLVMALVVALVLQTAAPTAAFVIVWPLTLGALAAALSAAGSWRPPAVTAMLGALGGLGTAWLLAYGHGIFQALDMVEALAAVCWLCALILWPLLQPLAEDRRQAVIALGLLLAGIAVTAWIALRPPWSARHPQITEVAYLVDQNTGTSRRVALTSHLTPWSEAVLLADGGKISRVSLPLLHGEPVWAAPALPVQSEGPIVNLQHRSDGSLLLRAIPPAGARIMKLDVRTSTPLTGVRINGIAARLGKPGQWIHIRWFGTPEGIWLAFSGGEHGVIETRFASITEVWPAGAKPLPRRPAEEMPANLSDSTYVAGAEQFSW